MCSQVARKLAQRGFLPDLILSSDSARTRQTLGAMADAEPAFGEAATSFRGSLYTVAALDGQTLRHLQACCPELSGPPLMHATDTECCAHAERAQARRQV